MVEFGQQDPRIIQSTPPPKPEQVPDEPILSETPVIDNIQANGDVETEKIPNETTEKAMAEVEDLKLEDDNHIGIDVNSPDYTISPEPAITNPDIKVEKPKSKNKPKHGKKKHKGGRKKNTGR